MLIDTNILIFAINADSDKNKRAIAFLKDNSEDLVISHQNVLEALRVITHPKFSNPILAKEAFLALMALIKSMEIINPNYSSLSLGLELINRHRLVGNRIFDAYLAATAISNGIDKIATDNVADFKKFADLKIVNPFVSPQV